MGRWGDGYGVHTSPSVCYRRDCQPPNPPILGGYEIFRFPQNWGLGGGLPGTLLDSATCVYTVGGDGEWGVRMQPEKLKFPTPLPSTLYHLPLHPLPFKVID
jgi:hypothetical protein